MYLPRHARKHSLKFLVYVEWILLLIVGLAQQPHVQFFALSPIAELNWIGLGSLALSSLWIPSRRSHRILYTIVIFSIVLILAVVGAIRLFSLLFLILVLRSWFLFKLRGCLTLTGIAIALCMLVQAYRFRFFNIALILSDPIRIKQIWLGSVFLAGLTLVFLQLLIAAIQSERQGREQLTVAHAKLRQYALEVEDLATVKERNRIAREIHDSLGHSLTVFNLHLEAALRLLQSEPEEARSLLMEAKELGSTALQEVRQSVTTLRSNPLQGRSLDQALTDLMTDFQRSTGISPEFHYCVGYVLSSQVEVAIYRILQEALTNICKYANATQVKVVIQTEQWLHLTIQDNGQGFDVTKNTTGFGLQSMQERTLALGGNFTLVTTPLAGCRIDAVFPLEPSL